VALRLIKGRREDAGILRNAKIVPKGALVLDFNDPVQNGGDRHWLHQNCDCASPRSKRPKRDDRHK